MTAVAVIMPDNELIKCCVNVNNTAFGLLKQLQAVDCAAACFFSGFRLLKFRDASCTCVEIAKCLRRNPAQSDEMMLKQLKKFRK